MTPLTLVAAVSIAATMIIMTPAERRCVLLAILIVGALVAFGLR